MLKTILSISGKPGLYKLISQGKNMLIVESVNAEKKRFPAYGNEKIISLADIAMYTDDAKLLPNNCVNTCLKYYLILIVNLYMYPILRNWLLGITS